MKLNRGGITPYPGRNDHKHRHMPESSFAGKDTGLLVGTRLTTSHHRALVARPADRHPGTLGGAWPAGRRSCRSAQPWRGTSGWGTRGRLLPLALLQHQLGEAGVQRCPPVSAGSVSLLHGDWSESESLDSAVSSSAGL